MTPNVEPIQPYATPPVNTYLAQWMSQYRESLLTNLYPERTRRLNQPDLYAFWTDDRADTNREE